MSYYEDEFVILPFSTNGDKIVSRDFKDKNILYRVEKLTLVDEDFYRDGENSGMDYEFVTEMYIITMDNNDYMIHYYYGGLVKRFSRSSSQNFFSTDSSKTDYSTSCVTNVSKLGEKLGSYNFMNELESLYSIAKMSLIKPLIKILNSLLKKEKQMFYKKKKEDEESYAKYLKSEEYVKKFTFPQVLSQLVKNTHCAYCKKLEIDLSFSFHRDSLCNDCIAKGIWSL